MSLLGQIFYFIFGLLGLSISKTDAFKKKTLSLILIILLLLCLLNSIIWQFIYLKTLSLSEYVFKIAIIYLHFISITILFVFLCHFHLLLNFFQIRRIPGLFPGGKNPPANAGDMSLIPDSERAHMLQSN